MFLLLAANETKSDSCIPIYRSDLVIASPLVNVAASWPRTALRSVLAGESPPAVYDAGMVAHACVCMSLCALILAPECSNACKPHYFLFPYCF